LFVNKIIDNENTTFKLKSPQERRKELQFVKQNMDSLKECSKKLSFNTKRARVMRNEYRNGILGIDDPISPNSNFYRTQNEKIVSKEVQHKDHLQKRQKNLARNYGVSEQIEFSTNEMSKRRDKMHHEISPFWSRKKR